MINAKKLCFCFLLATMAFNADLFGQDGQGKFRFGPELQAYPAGVIPGLRFSYNLSEHSDLNFRIGLNIADREDNGEHDNEEGEGPGFSAGWRHYASADQTRWFWGIRADVWFLEIDWEDTVDRIAAGTTDITVFQPTAEAGYRFGSGDGWSFTPSIALGYEINVETDGEDVGEGAILLGGISLTYRF